MINSIIRLSPLGGSGWVLIHYLLEGRWLLAVLMFPVVLITILWGSYNSGFITAESATAENFGYRSAESLYQRLKTLKKYRDLSVIGIFRDRLEAYSYLSRFIALATLFLYIIVSRFTFIDFSTGIALPFLIFFLLQSLYLAVSNYRITRGFYLNNEIEARELINFVQANSSNIDFTDGDGRAKKIITSADLEDITMDLLGEIQGTQFSS